MGMGAHGVPLLLLCITLLFLPRYFIAKARTNRNSGDYAHITNPYCLTVFGLYIAHYFNRSFIYPLSLTGPHNSLPLYIASLGFINNLASGFIQGFPEIPMYLSN